MRYYDYLNQNKDNIEESLERLFVNYKVQPVGYGYIDCIVMKNNFEGFVKELSNLGVAIYMSGWWCYVNPSHPLNNGCPHGMGGPQSEYYEGWFSELQNDYYDIGDNLVDNIKETYDGQLIISINMKVISDIYNLLMSDFRYTPKDFIKENKCVMPGLWLLVPDNWRRNK
jgi:hypothetical protein